MRSTDPNCALLAQDAAGVTSLTQRLDALEADRSEFDRAMDTYVADHKLAVAALWLGMGGAGAALDPDNEFSDEAETLGGLFAVAAATYAILNHQEIVEVADLLFKAHVYGKSINADIVETRSGLTSQSENFDRSRTAVKALRLHCGPRVSMVDGRRFIV